MVTLPLTGVIGSWQPIVDHYPRFAFWLRAIHLTLTVIVAIVIGLSLVGVEMLTRRWVRSRAHVREYVAPLAAAVGWQLGLDASRWRQWLDVPTRHLDARAPIRIELPPGFAQLDLLPQLDALVSTRLGLSDWTMHRHLSGRAPYVEWTANPRPRDRVPYAMIQAIVAAQSDAAPLLGLGVGDVPLSVDLDADAPHMALSAGSGAGKSVLIRFLLAQLLAKGCRVVILDPKQTSQHWASDLPGVVYAVTGEEMHAALVAQSEEVTRRSALVRAQPADIDIDNLDFSFVGPRTIVVAEELNMAATHLRKYWQKVRTSSDPKVSPAFDAILNIVCTGRFVRCHMFAIAQMLTAEILGGPAARENFGTRIMARYSRNNWKMLVPEIPFRKTPRVRGRVQICLGGEAHECQVGYMETSEARELALTWTRSGRPDPWSWQPDPDGDTSGITAWPPAATAVEPQVAPDDVIVSVGPGRPVTLRQADDEGLAPAHTLSALRRASQRPGFPAKVGTNAGGANLYWDTQIREWADTVERTAEVRDKESAR